jgi:hypothetical protein
MKHAAEMGSGAMIYIPSFIKICSGIQKLIGGIHRHSMVISQAYLLFFQNKESGQKMGFAYRICVGNKSTYTACPKKCVWCFKVLYFS